MTVESALFSHLQGVTSITDLIGSGRYMRFYSSAAKQGTSKPYLVQQNISERRYPHMLGASDLVRRRQQIDIYADTSDEVSEAFKALRLEMNGKQHQPLGANQLPIVSINFDDADSSFRPASDGSDIGTARTTVDMIIVYYEEI